MTGKGNVKTKGTIYKIIESESRKLIRGKESETFYMFFWHNIYKSSNLNIIDDYEIV